MLHGCWSCRQYFGRAYRDGEIHDDKLEVFDFEINVIVTNDNKGQDCLLILERSFMETVKSLEDLELKEVLIRSNGFYQCYKVNPPPAD